MTKHRSIARICTGAFLAGLLAAATALPAQAYSTWYGNRLIYGIGGGGQAYWIASSAAGYTGSIDAAMRNWINTSSRIGVRTPLYWTKTTTKSAARMEVHAVNLPTAGYCAKTYHYKQGALVTPWTGPNQNWVWGKFDINAGIYWTSGCTNRQGIISHEMGHVFGLAHNGDSSTLMYTYVAGTGVLWATVDEANGINALY